MPPLKPRLAIMGQYSFTIRPEKSSRVSGCFFFLKSAPAGAALPQEYSRPRQSGKRRLRGPWLSSSSALAAGFQLRATAKGHGVTLKKRPLSFLEDNSHLANQQAALMGDVHRPAVGGKALGPPLPPAPPDACTGIAALVLLHLPSCLYPALDIAERPDIGKCLAFRIGQAFGW